VLRTAMVIGYALTVLLALNDLWQARGSGAADDRRIRRRAFGVILMMSAIPIALFQNRLSTFAVIALALALVGPGVWLYRSATKTPQSRTGS
jgi:hypothetical protein